MAAPPTAPLAADPDPTTARWWLEDFELLPEGARLGDTQCIRQYLAFSQCDFSDEVERPERVCFMQSFLPHKSFLAVRQTDIGRIWDPKVHYKLELTNETPITAKPVKLKPE